MAIRIVSGNYVMGTPCLICDDLVVMNADEMEAYDAEGKCWAMLCTVCSSRMKCRDIAQGISNGGGYLGPE